MTILSFEFTFSGNKFPKLWKNCVIFNTEFDQGLEDLLQRNFDLDDLGLKDNIRTSGLGFAKNPKRPESEWTPAEKLIDGKMVVTQVSSNPKSVFITLVQFHGKVMDLIL